MLNPPVVEVMAEIGIDIANNRTKSVFDLLERGECFDDVITVCDDVSADEVCPDFRGPGKKIHRGVQQPGVDRRRPGREGRENKGHR